jgi:hypothetical protein
MCKALSFENHFLITTVQQRAADTESQGCIIVVALEKGEFDHVPFHNKETKFSIL